MRNVGHTPQWEQPAGLASLIEGFAQTHRPGFRDGDQSNYLRALDRERGRLPSSQSYGATDDPRGAAQHHKLVAPAWKGLAWVQNDLAPGLADPCH